MDRTKGPFVLELRLDPAEPVRWDRAAVEAARLQREARARLLREAGAVTVAMAAEGRRSNDNATRQWLHRHRRAGRLISVEHAGDVVIPTFQLDEVFDLDPLAGDVIEVLHAAGVSAWATWHWFHTSNGWLGGRPVDALARRDREALLGAASRLIDAA